MSEQPSDIVAVFIDRESQTWIVRDNHGELWTVPAGANGWDRRCRYEKSDRRVLEPVPGHYKYMFGLSP
ncbi:MAG: hypothetical protein K1X57_12525 [Gemmataceae bacterium]|nr:hypothetical protein [Gemmataceae bacterium]